MGAETQNQRLAGDAASRARLMERVRSNRTEEVPRMSPAESRARRIRAIEDRGAAREAANLPAGRPTPVRAGAGRAPVIPDRRPLASSPEPTFGIMPVGEARPVGREPEGTYGIMPVGEARPAVSPRPGFEEAIYRRAEVTNERDRSGSREELYENFRRAAEERSQRAETAPGGAVERGATLFGTPLGGAGRGPEPVRAPEVRRPEPDIRSGVSFGPGRSTRVPDRGTPDYARLAERVRALGRR